MSQNRTKFKIMENKSESSIEDKIHERLNVVVRNCKDSLYPNICRMRNTKNGEERIFRAILDICSKTGMPIESAVAQYESSL